MYIIGNFFLAIAEIFEFILTVFMWIVAARAIISWFNPDPSNPIIKFINASTEPILSFVRSKLPIEFSGIDFSPIVVFISIMFLKTFVINSLVQAARSLG